MKALNDLVNNALKGIVSIGQKRAAKKPAPPIADAAFDYLGAPQSDRFTAGFGKEVLLPDDIDKRRYYIAGYRDNNPARGVIDPQYACAVWLDDNSGRGGVLLIALDAVGLLRNDVLRLKEGLSDFAKKTGCRAITVTCTHNHAGIDTMGLWGPLPLSGRDPRFMRLVFEGAKRAAIAAFADRRRGRLFFGKTEVPDMQEDIRTPEVYCKDLSRFRFVPDDGSREIWILNFASHSESLQGCNSLVSADFPCYLRERIREETGAETLYTVGAIGGMISMKIDDEDLLRREHRLLESTRGIGRKLSGYALGIAEERELEPLINRITQEFYLPVENPLLTVAGQIGIIRVDRVAVPGMQAAAAIRSQLSYMEIGDVKLLFLPCELFPELAYGGYLPAEGSATGKGPEANPTPLLELAADGNVVLFGLADDELGYVLPPNDFYLNPQTPYLDKGIDRHGRRHYEETNSAGPETARVIAETFQKILTAVNAAKKQ